MNLQDLCERIVRDAIPATDSGATCFVPRYQIDQLREAIAAAPQPPAEAQGKWKALIGSWQRRAEAAGYEGIEGVLEAAEAQAQGGGEVVGVVDGGDRGGSISQKATLLRPLRAGTNLYTAPPSAPVGVEGRAREAVALALDEAGHHTEANNVRKGIDLDEYRVELAAARIALAQQPASDGGFTAADMMDARQEGRKEGQQSAAVDGVCEAMAAIGHLIATQDNRITASPIFIVQQKRLYAADPECDYDRLVWVDGDGEAGAEDAERLDEEYAETGIEPAGWRRAAEAHYWDFVTACFTEQGCKDYIARDGHNLREPRIYAAGSYRNTEWQAVRSYLIALAAQQGGDHA